MPPALFETKILASEWPQTHTLRHHGRHIWWYLRHPSTLTPLQESSDIYNKSKIQSPLSFQTFSVVTWLRSSSPIMSALGCLLGSCHVPSRHAVWPANSSYITSSYPSLSDIAVIFCHLTSKKRPPSSFLQLPRLSLYCVRLPSSSGALYPLCGHCHVTI
jgi:hypothetical protein